MTANAYLAPAFDRYMKAIEVADDGLAEYPTDPNVPPGEAFSNSAGTIHNLAIGNFKTATLIYSKHGSIRSNHYHKTDWHIITVVEGVMQYWWKKVGLSEPPKLLMVYPGQSIFTGPMIAHATFFPKSTTLFVVSKNPRDHESHEKDIVRMNLIEVSNGNPIVCL